MKVNPNDPAYPCEQGHCPDGTWNQTWNPGMPIRLKIASEQMANSATQSDEYSTRAVAIWALDRADALLAAYSESQEDEAIVAEVSDGEGIGAE